jgi:hypothetical protein
MVAVRVERDGESHRGREIGRRTIVTRRTDELESRAENGVEAVRRLPKQLDAVAAEDVALLEQPEQPDEAEERVAGVVRDRAGRRRPGRSRGDQARADGRGIEVARAVSAAALETVFVFYTAFGDRALLGAAF